MYRETIRDVNMEYMPSKQPTVSKQMASTNQQQLTDGQQTANSWLTDGQQKVNSLHFDTQKPAVG